MVMKGLILLTFLYLLGLFAAACGYLFTDWNSDWELSTQLWDAVRAGATWPGVVIELFLGS